MASDKCSQTFDFLINQNLSHIGFSFMYNMIPVVFLLFVYNLGGFVFAKPMRAKKCVTMLDHFHLKYGKVLAAVLAVASMSLDVLALGSILICLGT